MGKKEYVGELKGKEMVTLLWLAESKQKKN